MITLDAKYSTTQNLHKRTSKKLTSKSKNVKKFVNFSDNPILSEKEDRYNSGGLVSKGYIKKSSVKKPLITIITVVLNGAEFVEDTINSVLEQTYSNIEFIVIDGGSTDNTLEIIKKYENMIDWWVSEKDDGIYSAMNKGLSLTSGKWVYFLNCRDLFISRDIILKIIKFLNPQNSVVHFNCEVRNNQGYEINVRPFPTSLENLKKWPALQHQSLFCQSSLFSETGRFNIGYRVLADYDLFIRLYKNNAKFVFYKDIKIAIYNSEGFSDNKNNIFIVMKEARMIQNTHFGKTNWVFQLQLLFKLILRFSLIGNAIEKHIRNRYLSKR